MGAKTDSWGCGQKHCGKPPFSSWTDPEVVITWVTDGDRLVCPSPLGGGVSNRAIGGKEKSKCPRHRELVLEALLERKAQKSFIYSFQTR